MEKVIRIGKVSRLHGFKGELSLKVDQEFISSMEEADLLLLELDKKQVPFFIESFRLTTTGFVLMKFEDVDTEADANRLRNAEIFLREEDVIEEDMEDDGLQKLLGFQVIDLHKGEIGEVAEVTDIAGNTFLIIDREDGEVYIPFHEDIVEEVDEENAIIRVSTPEGLIELNLE